jgi:hypothetical protein
MEEKIMNKIDEDFYKENNYYLSITDPKSFAEKVAIEFANEYGTFLLQGGIMSATTYNETFKSKGNLVDPNDDFFKRITKNAGPRD